MRGESKSLIWGGLLIVLGVILLGNNLGWFYMEWEMVWPLFMIGGGVLFWMGWFARRQEIGLVMPGTILLVYGLLFEYCAMFGWYWMEYYWPAFLFGPGLGLLFMYLLGRRENGLLIPASILILLAILFWMKLDFFRFFWPLLLIAIGVYLLLKVWRQKSNSTAEIVEDKSETE